MTFVERERFGIEFDGSLLLAEQTIAHFACSVEQGDLAFRDPDNRSLFHQSVDEDVVLSCAFRGPLKREESSQMSRSGVENASVNGQSPIGTSEKIFEDLTYLEQMDEGDRRVPSGVRGALVNFDKLFVT
jgi:hypothetical protein